MLLTSRTRLLLRKLWNRVTEQISDVAAEILRLEADLQLKAGRTQKVGDKDRVELN